MADFDGKVALITGGSSGIGRAAAVAFAREGAQVVLAARGAERGEQVERDIREAGGEATFVPADMAKPGDIERLVARTAELYGRLDCALNNAASVEGAFQRTADFDNDAFDRVIQTNVKGVWLGMKHQIRQMLRQEPPGGAIVNTSSVNGLGGAPQAALYSASKAAVLALTKSAAQEYAAQGIRINALVPGAFRTPMLETVFDRASDGDEEARAAAEAQYEQFSAFGRIGRPEEAAAAVLWLCSDAASFVAGHSLIVDGGATAAMR